MLAMTEHKTDPRMCLYVITEAPGTRRARGASSVTRPSRCPGITRWAVKAAGRSWRGVGSGCRVRRDSGGVSAGGIPGKGGDMTEYLIVLHDEWVPDHTAEELREKSRAVRALAAEMKAAGVFVFLGGLDDAAPVFSVDASSGTPLFTDGPFIESKEHLGGFAVVDVADEEAARLWAGKIAVACGWPQEVRRFRVPMQLPETP